MRNRRQKAAIRQDKKQKKLAESAWHLWPEIRLKVPGTFDQFF